MDDYRVYLTTPVVGRNDYINAVFLSVSLAESFANILKHINIATCNFIHNEYIFVIRHTQKLTRWWSRAHLYHTTWVTSGGWFMTIMSTPSSSWDPRVYLRYVVILYCIDKSNYETIQWCCKMINKVIFFITYHSHLHLLFCVFSFPTGCPRLKKQWSLTLSLSGEQSVSQVMRKSWNPRPNSTCR